MSGRTPSVLCVLSHMHDADFFMVLAGLLEERGVRVSFLSTDYTIERRAWILGRRAPNVMHTRVPDGAPGFPEDVSLENICRYVLAHPSLDVHYLTLFEQADRLVRAYAKHFDRIRPDMVMSWNGTIPRMRAAMKLAEARGICTLYFEQGNFPNTIICDPKGVNYEGSMRGFDVPRTFNRERIEGYLAQLRAKAPPRPRAMAVAASSLVEAVINYFPRRSPFHPTLYFDHDKMIQPKRFLCRVKQHLKGQLGRAGVSDDTVRVYPRRFVFLPLQVHDDTQIIVHSPYIRTMEELVDETIEALPASCDLVVKSHPADTGRRGYRLIAEMCEDRRCHFVHCASTPDLIERAACVVTVNSTVGLEALARFKPVVVLGDAVYAGRGITVDVTGVADYGAKLREALSFRPDKDEVKRFLDYYIFEYSKPGNFRRPDPAELRPLVADILDRLDLPRTRPAPAVTVSAPTETPQQAAPAAKDSLVSIIMPAYNTGRYIAQAVRSVLAQSYPHYELIVVDDGSTDDTVRVVSSFDDARITLIRTAKRGPAAARNAALARATGDFVAFLDSDDVWLPRKLELQLDAFEAAPDVGVSYTNVRRVGEDGRRIKSHRFSLARLPRGQCADRLLVRNGVIAMSTVMMRRSVLDATGSFAEDLPAGQDWDLWQRAALHCRFGYIPRCLAVYRIRSGSISSQHDLRTRYDGIIIERAFGCEEVRRRFSPGRLRRLRRRAEAVRQYNAGSLALRAGDLTQATDDFLASARMKVYDFRQIAMIVISVLARLPMIDRDYLLDVVRK